MTCTHPNCTGKHRASGSKDGVCPAALAKRRAGQLRRYHERYKEKARERRRSYYLANREHILAKVRGYYRAHRAQEIARCIEKNRRRRNGGIVPFRRPPRPEVIAPSERQWWKLKESEIPKRWILEAAA